MGRKRIFFPTAWFLFAVVVNTIDGNVLCLLLVPKEASPLVETEQAHLGGGNSELVRKLACWFSG